ncbi:hypothetical protein BDV96DRAFT_641612 [Lophiotrema nucula]|uniref:C2H2-type domain-containing protein n=1 Tax=Lophiotrema nucula TaxID=690887 RepID=A0A6A5ZQ58_9PLEO|nr:hypothetical protein BDV96DRAFT_641612 [Lophiotrema nucula]
MNGGHHLTPTTSFPGSSTDPVAYDSNASSPTSSFRYGGAPFDELNNTFTPDYTISPDWSPLDTRRNSNAMSSGMSPSTEEVTTSVAYNMTVHPTNQLMRHPSSGYVQQPLPSLPESGQSLYNTPVTGEVFASPYSTDSTAATFNHNYYQGYGGASTWASIRAPHYEQSGTVQETMDKNSNAAVTYGGIEPTGCLPALQAVKNAASTLTNVLTGAIPGRVKRTRLVHYSTHHGRVDPAPLPCGIGDCEEVFTGKFKGGNRARHVRQQHSLTPQVPCRSFGCQASFRRSDARKKHEKRQHNLDCPRASRRGAPIQPPALDALIYHHQHNDQLRISAPITEAYNH